MVAAGMSLLRQIQEAAASGETPLADLLRRCKILAARLGHEPLPAWVDNELNGYQDDETLPTYRDLGNTGACGHFMGLFHSELKNVPLPMSGVEEQHRDILFGVKLTQGIAHYETLVRAGQDSFKVPWPADYTLYYQDGFLENNTLMAAWRTVSAASLIGMLDQVRNRILTFALEIEAQNPEAGEAMPGGDPPVSPDVVSQIFNTYVIGGQNNVIAAGNKTSIHDFEQVGQNDWEALRTALEKLGLSGTDIDALHGAILDDGDVQGEQEPGPAVRDWLWNILERVGSGMLTLTSNTGSAILATLILQHLGIVNH